MKHSGCDTATTSGHPKSSKSSCVINHTHNLDCSPNSSFENNYQRHEDERKSNNFAYRFLVAACEAGYTSWDSDPVGMADFLKEIKEEHGFDINTNMDEIKKRLSALDKRIKKRSSLYQSYNNEPSKKTNNESPSTFGASTSYSPGAQTSDNMVVVKDEKNIEVNKDVHQNPDRAVMANQAIGNGRKAGIFVIRRVLNPTDIDEYQCRLSMPCNQVRNIDDFLTRGEVLTLSEKAGVPAKVIDSNNRIYDTNLRKVKAGPKTYSYAIGKPWNRIKMDNGFEVGMVIEVRVFRGDRGEPCFILERVG